MEQPVLPLNVSTVAPRPDGCPVTVAVARAYAPPSAAPPRAYRCGAAKRIGPPPRLCFPRKRRRRSRRYLRAPPRHSLAGSWHLRSARSCPPSCDSPTQPVGPRSQLLRQAEDAGRWTRNAGGRESPPPDAAECSPLRFCEPRPYDESVYAVLRHPANRGTTIAIN